MTELCDSGGGKAHRRRKMWCMSRWNLCVYSCCRPQMERKNAANGARRVCRARHAAKHGRKCAKMGDFGWKTGGFEWKVPGVRLFVPKGGGEKQEKAEERGGRGEGIREKCAIWGSPTGGMRWANRESPACGKNSCSAVATQRKNNIIFAAPKPFPPNQHRWNSSSTNAESPWCDCSNR